MIKINNVPSLYQAMYGVIDYCRSNEGDKIEIIVPDKLSLFMEKFFFEKMNLESSFDIRVSTLNRFAKKNLAIDKNFTISKLGSILLIHNVMNENIDNLLALKSKAYSFTYAENIFRTIAQIKASKITADELMSFTSSDEQLKNKIHDLGLIYGGYETKKAGLLDASDQFLASVMTVEQGREDSRLVFVGFDDFTAIEYSIIERLAISNGVTIFNYRTNNGNKQIYNHEIIDQLKTIAYINELPFEIEDREYVFDEFRTNLERNLYNIKHVEIKAEQDKIRVFSGNSVTDEIEWVARDIRKKILLGDKYANFGVAVYGIESSLIKIKEIFSKYEINYYLDSEMPLNKSIFYKFLLSIFKYNFNSYNLCHLIDVINSPFFVLDRDAKDQLISKLISINFKGKILDKTNIGEKLQDSLLALKNFLSYFDIDKTTTTAEYIEKIKLANVDLKISDTLETLANNNVDLQHKIVLTKSYKIVLELLEEILKFNIGMPIESFVDVFEHIAGVVNINNLPLTLDAVKIVDANNTMEIFDNLYIVNMTADNAPSLKYDCGVILDTEIEKLNFSHKLSPTIAHINKLSKLRVYNLVSLFEDTLTITYSNNPSEVIKEFMNKVVFNVDGQDYLLAPISSLGFGEYEALSDWDYITESCKNNLENTNISSFINKNKDFSLNSKENLEKIKNINTISASRLEEYFRCPLKMFLSSRLKINPRIDPDIQSFDIGNILHDILYVYYKLDKNVGDVYEFCKKKVYEHIDHDERLKLNANNLIIKNLIDEAVRTIEGMNYIDENSSFAPDKRYLEYDFSKTPLRLSNINIVGKIDRVDRSYNDNEDSHMLRVVDYKSGNANPSLKELYYGQKLQLFLYSTAIENILKDSAVVGCFYLKLHNDYTRELGNCYSLNGFFINEENIIKSFDKRLVPGRKSDIVNVNMTSSGLARRFVGNKELSSSEMSRLKEYAKSVSEKAVDEIKSGYIQPSPSGISNPCDFCPYLQICMKNSAGVSYRDGEDVVLDSFSEVEDGRV